MTGRRTKRADGRYTVTLSLENTDGTKRRAYFYSRTRTEAKADVDRQAERSTTDR